jgi:hypothetical protein
MHQNGKHHLLDIIKRIPEARLSTFSHRDTGLCVTLSCTAFFSLTLLL